VTDDGAETDLRSRPLRALFRRGHQPQLQLYIGQDLRLDNKKERRGDYLGGTVQVVPPRYGEICESIRSVVTPQVTWSLWKSAGTVGDIESLPFLEALRILPHPRGKNNCFFIHVTLIPYLSKSGEVKPSPTQHSVGQGCARSASFRTCSYAGRRSHLDVDVKKKISAFLQRGCRGRGRSHGRGPHHLRGASRIRGAGYRYGDHRRSSLRAGRRNLTAVGADYVDKVMKRRGRGGDAVVGKVQRAARPPTSPIHESLHTRRRPTACYGDKERLRE